jgi:signal transduction histidine kinase/CheY-like chemotaxis protein
MKFTIGLKIAALSILLVVVTVAATAWTSYQENKALLVDQLRRGLADELHEQDGRLKSVVQQLQSDVLALAGGTRMQRLLAPELRIKKVQGVFTEEEYRGFSAEAFRSELEPRDNYLELAVLRKENGSWVVPVHAWRDAAGCIASSVDGKPLTDEGALRLLPAGDEPREGVARLGRIEPRGEPGSGREPVLVIRCLAPVYQTLEQPKRLLGFVAITADFSGTLNGTARRGGPAAVATAPVKPAGRAPDMHKVRYVADEHGDVLAASGADDLFHPVRPDARRPLPETYPGLAPLFEGKAPPEQDIDYRANPGGHAGRCLRVNLWPDDPGRFLALTVAVPHDQLAAQAPAPPRTLLLVAAALVAAAAGLAFWFGRVLTRPLRKMTAAAQGLAEGKFDVALPAADRSEVGVLARAFRHMVEQVRKRGQELQESEARVRAVNETLEHRVQERTLALGKANDALELARDQALAANRAKSAFLAQMSHELRTPLNAIIGYSELLQEEAGAAGHAEYLPDLRKIVEAGRHLLTLINDVLDLSKLEAGKMELCLETFEVGPLVAGVVDTVRPLADKNGNALEVRCPEQAGLMRADPTRVRQVLFNLLSNACKFTSRGQVVLEVERRAAPDADGVTFRVRDTGRGIKPEELKRIFQPFEQGDAATTRQYGGTGLGLSISRRLCQMMGGEIDVESRWGEGSTFTVRLPAEVDPRPAAPATPAAAPASPAAAGSSPVLVVDDDLAVRDLLQRFLTKEGFQVLTASTGEEGVRLAKQLRPTAITLDVLMPGMDGWKVLTMLKTDPETSDIPVIMLTIVDNKNLGHALGATDYLPKPVDRARLTALLHKYQARGSGRDILLVEDEADTRELLRRSLEKAGWSVREAVNGRDALEQVGRQAPSLILLDLMMPEMDGFELLEELRQRPAWRTIPVVVITAKELTEEDRLRLSGSLLLSGCVKRVLQKGQYRREDLLREVRELMAQHTDEPQGGS